MLNDLIRQEQDKRDVKAIEISRKTGFAKSYISNILNKKQEVGDDTAVTILVKGLNYRPSEARELISKWRIEEYKEKAGLSDEDYPTENVGGMSGIRVQPFYLSNLATLEGDITTTERKEHFAPIAKHNEYKYRALEAEELYYPPRIPKNSLILIELTAEYEPERIHVFKMGDRYQLGELVRSAAHYEVKTVDGEKRIPLDSPDFRIVGIVRQLHVNQM